MLTLSSSDVGSPSLRSTCVCYPQAHTSSRPPPTPRAKLTAVQTSNINACPHCLTSTSSKATPTTAHTVQSHHQDPHLLLAKQVGEHLGQGHPHGGRRRLGALARAHERRGREERGERRQHQTRLPTTVAAQGHTENKGVSAWSRVCRRHCCSTPAASRAVQWAATVTAGRRWTATGLPTGQATPPHDRGLAKKNTPTRAAGRPPSGARCVG